MTVRNDRAAHGCILITGSVVAENKICHAPVIPEGCTLSQEFLSQPRIHMIEYDLFPVTGQRPGQTGYGIKIRFCRFHNPECNVIPYRLHFGQCIGVGICHICPAGHTAHERILKWLYDIADGIRF